MILVCGDAMKDQYWFGDVARISPEAPVPVVAVMKEESRRGAAHNVVANIEALGAIAKAATCETSTKIRLVARNQQVARIDFDKPPTPNAIAEMESQFTHYLSECNIVVFSDYAKGSLVSIRYLINMAKHNGKIVLVDPKGHDYQRYSGADMIKPNAHELREMIGGWSDEKQLERRVRQMMTDAGIGNVLLTRAAEGMTLFHENGSNSVAADTREVYDVTGAGDTAIAAYSVALELGYSRVEAMHYANKAAGIVCGKFGTAVASKEEVFGTT